MDFSPLLIPLVHAMKWLIPLVVLAAIIQSALVQGIGRKVAGEVRGLDQAG